MELSNQHLELKNKVTINEEFQLRLTEFHNRIENISDSKNVIRYINDLIWHYKNQALIIENSGLERPEFKMMLQQVLIPELSKWEKIHQEQDTHSVISQTNEVLGNEPAVKLINCSASAEQITNYFMLLVTLGFMTEEDVKDFLYNTFAVFRNPNPVQKKYPINLKNKRALLYLVYRFYFEFDATGSKTEYATLLKNSFDKFNQTTLLTISSNMAKPPSKQYLVPIEEHFKKLRY
ncbi:MAG: hypothetical protein JNK50_01060 [Bacteroidia bacterium]|nr:hypothetical protein [Bacteroidia bacterium]